MNLANIFTSKFIFDPTPSSESGLYLPFTIIFGVLIVLGVLAIILPKGDVKKILRGYISPLFTCGFLGLVNLGARYEQLPWFGSRFLFGIVILTLIIWLLTLAFLTVRFYPAYIKEKETISRFEKYLPKKKHK
jgi:hypothetical protein